MVIDGNQDVYYSLESWSQVVFTLQNPLFAISVLFIWLCAFSTFAFLLQGHFKNSIQFLYKRRIYLERKRRQFRMKFAWNKIIDFVIATMGNQHKIAFQSISKEYYFEFSEFNIYIPYCVFEKEIERQMQTISTENGNCCISSRRFDWHSFAQECFYISNQRQMQTKRAIVCAHTLQ